MKFCVDCEHCTATRVSNHTEYLCNQAVDLVTGEFREAMAWEMRHGSRCGKEGNLFKRKASNDRYRTDIPELK